MAFITDIHMIARFMLPREKKKIVDFKKYCKISRDIPIIIFNVVNLV